MVMKDQDTAPERPRFVRLSQEDVPTTLGPLARFVGTWVGNHGWNLIAVPQAPKEPGGKEFFTLLVRPYYETITFTPLGVLVPDRGASETLSIFGLEYTLRVSDLLTKEPLHLENGMWLYMNDPQKLGSPSIARHATVPHGNSVLALGSFRMTEGPPSIPDISSMPDSQPEGAPFGYADVYDPPLEPQDLQDIVPHFVKSNPNKVLQDAVSEQNILDTVTFDLSTQNGGGIVNIPFVEQNANATAFNATFWLERVKHPQTGDVHDQLQYSQQTNLEFLTKEGGQGLVMWPHVNVNTLVRQ